MTTPVTPAAGRLHSIAIIGSGPSCVFLLKRLLEFPPSEIPHRITIFEKSADAGKGMPYRDETTDRHHLSNISSEEIPTLLEDFADWLARASAEDLATWGIEREAITAKAIYPRLALGGYFQSQYRGLIRELEKAGVEIDEKLETIVTDLGKSGDASGIRVSTGEGEYSFDAVVIATGHQWPKDDRPDDGFFASPWPIWKLVPAAGVYFDFPVGILGASLSAFDVVTTLAHNHGEFRSEDGRVVYQLYPGAGRMRLILHSADGQLPHLLFEQTEARRTIYRHTTREKLAGLVDPAGFLPLRRFFDEVCRPVLAEGFRRDGREDIAALLDVGHLTLPGLVEKLSSEHAYDDPFEGMRAELEKAGELGRRGQPTHWKEYLDDLFYTLNFHSELLSAEDHLMLRKEILPFVMGVAAAMPLDSARKLLALREAGVIGLVAGKAEIDTGHKGHGSTRIVVDDDGEIREETFRMFVDCGGQDPSGAGRHPFPSLFRDGLAIPATVRFRDAANASEVEDEKRLIADESGTRLDLGGLGYDLFYRLLPSKGSRPASVFDLALPDINGLRPYSYGLQAADEAARICASVLAREPSDYGIR